MRALREAITNAVMHRDYFEVGTNVFVEIYDDRIEISNLGGLPKGLSRAELGTRSVRRNPLIADLLHLIAFIEKAGTGIRRMREEARGHKCPEPQFAANGFFTATFWPTSANVHRVAGEVGGEVGPYAMKILELCVEPQPRRVIGAAIGVSKWDNLKPHIAALIEAGWLAMTIPDKPRSSKQRYKTTDLGLKVLSQREGGEGDG